MLLGAKCRKGDVSQGCGSLILGRDPAGIVPHLVAYSMKELELGGKEFVVGDPLVHVMMFLMRKIQGLQEE